jgi:hypothetical protein
VSTLCLFITQIRVPTLLSYVAIERVRRDRGFVFGKGVSPTAEVILFVGLADSSVSASSTEASCFLR